MPGLRSPWRCASGPGLQNELFLLQHAPLFAPVRVRGLPESALGGLLRWTDSTWRLGKLYSVFVFGVFSSRSLGIVSSGSWKPDSGNLNTVCDMPIRSYLVDSTKNPTHHYSNEIRST